MTRNQTVFVLLLTVMYLCIELAFNARLLDVVGEGATTEQVHSIENWGRLLSGIAVALVVLQVLLYFREKSSNKLPGSIGILFWCLLAIVIVFFGLRYLVDGLVENSSGTFRKASMNIVLIQKALVRGNIILDGLVDDPHIFSKPEGKAFLALFPVMAISVDQLDERIRDAKLKLIAQHIENETGGAAGYYDKYVKALVEAQTQWRKYSGIPVVGDVDDVIESQHHESWGKYNSDLRRHGWTPSTVPYAYRSKVVKNVRKQVPVPSNWDPSDEDGFHDAIASKVRRKVSKAGVTINGQRIAPGLGWNDFLVLPVIQENLRNNLSLPKDVRLQVTYTPESFETNVFNRMVQDNTQRQLVLYESPSQTYENGGRNVSIGLDSARAVIVPPVALFFSLLGAIGHIAKFTYLVASLTPSIQMRIRPLWLVPMCALTFMVTALLLVDNPVTNSRIYNYMSNQVLVSAAKGNIPLYQAHLLIATLHDVSVGQGYGYPVNEFIRIKVLREFNFGYELRKN